MSRYSKHTLPSGYIDILFDGKPMLSVHPDACAPNERLAEWLRECLCIGRGSCTLEIAAPKMVEALEEAREEIAAWRAGLNARNMNKCKVGAKFADMTRISAAIAAATGKEG